MTLLTFFCGVGSGKDAIFATFMTGRSKDIFRFKEFGLSNSLSAMRVGTDGVLLGAWVAEIATRLEECLDRIWDVGAGTGLVGLMVAQRVAQCKIDMIEIDADAAQECRLNAVSSPWSARIAVHHGDVMAISDLLDPPDMIVSNPPYFYGGPKASDGSRAAARHVDGGGGLGAITLIGLASQRLSDVGRLCMILPAELEDTVMMECVMSRLNIHEVVDVYTRPGKKCMRQLWLIGRQNLVMTRRSLYVHDANGGYDTEYRHLTEPYYLDF